MANFTDDYYKRLMLTINEQVDKITMNNYDDILKEAKVKTDKYYGNIRTNHKRKVSNPTDKPKDSINPNIKKMTVGQDNVKEASKYTRFYGYSVKVVEHRYNDKNNFVFSLDNSFFKKLLTKPIDRFRHQTGQVSFQSIVFKYKPKRERELINGEVIYFQPFEIVLNTMDCHDMVYYHTNNNGSNQEVLKGLYILNLQKVIDRLKEIFGDLHLSEKAMSNMLLSTSKHLNDVQSPNRYGVDNFEEYCNLSEDQALVIMDDYDDDELADSLISYIE